MRAATLLLMVLVAVAVVPVMAEQTVASTPSPGGASSGSLRPGTLIFDQGPSTGAYGGCWANGTSGQNFADQATLVDPAEIDEIRVFTCLDPLAGTVHVKILADDGAGNPAGVEAHGGRIGDITIYGQESNPNTFKLAKMNLAIRGIVGDLG